MNMSGGPLRSGPIVAASVIADDMLLNWDVSGKLSDMNSFAAMKPEFRFLALDTAPLTLFIKRSLPGVFPLVWDRIVMLAFGGDLLDVSNSQVRPLGLRVPRTLRERALDTLSVKDYGAIADGTSHPVQEWVTGGRYGSLAAIQADYPHVATLFDEIDWAATQAAANAYAAGNYSTAVRLPAGKLILNRDVYLSPGQRAVKGEGSGASEVKFTGGSNGFWFPNGGQDDRVQFAGFALSTSQFSVGNAFTVSFLGTVSSTEQAVFQDINVKRDGGVFRYGTVLYNVRSPAYTKFFFTGHITGTLAAHIFLGTTTDIRFNSSFVLDASVGFNLNDLCEGLVLNDTIAISVDVGVKSNYPNGKPWVQINGGQIAAYKIGLDLYNAKQVHVVATTMYAAGYDKSRMADYIGIKLAGPDTRNVLIHDNYFQADGYVPPAAPGPTTRKAIQVLDGAYGLIFDNQFSGFDFGISLSSTTNDWRIMGNQMLSVTAEVQDAGGNNFYQNATPTGRELRGAGGFKETISGATAAHMQLQDRGAAVDAKNMIITYDNGIGYLRHLKDDGSIKAEVLSFTGTRLRLGGNSGATAAMSIDFEGNAYLLKNGLEYKITPTDANDTAGAGFRALKVPNV